MSKSISKVSKPEIVEITERIAEMSVEILEKVEVQLGTTNEAFSPDVSFAGSYDEAVKKRRKTNEEQKLNVEITEDQNKELVLKKIKIQQGVHSRNSKVKPPVTNKGKSVVFDEIEKIKLEIQAKINNEIIPKLESIKESYQTTNTLRLNSTSDRNSVENMSMSSEPFEEVISYLSDASSYSSINSVVSDTSNCVADGRLESSVIDAEECDQPETVIKPKTDLSNATRYTKAQIIELRCDSFAEHIERLESLKLLRSINYKIEVPLEWQEEIQEDNINLSELDRFLLQLLSLSSVQREEYILLEAKNRKLLVSKSNIFQNSSYYVLNGNICDEYDKCQMEVQQKIMSYMQPTTPLKQPKPDYTSPHLFSSFLYPKLGLSQSPPIKFNFDKTTPDKSLKRQRQHRNNKELFIDQRNLDIEIREKKGEVNNDVAYKEQFLELFRHSFEPEMPTGFDGIINYLVESGKASLVVGELRVNAKNWNESYVTNKGSNDVLVGSVILRKWALHGDIVKVLVKKSLEDVGPVNSLDDTQNSESDLEIVNKEKVHRSLGVVLNIVEQRNTRKTIGIFQAVVPKKRQYSYSFLPRDTKLPTIFINTNENQMVLMDTLYMVEITHWLKFQPYGKVVKCIGKVNSLDSENTAILLKHNLDPMPYSEEIIASVPQVPFEIPISEFANREDLRKKCIFSIDPDTARDLDDAMSCEVLSNGNWEVGVHISDVSFFLKENDPLDLLVKEKATTIYLVNQVYHMLPLPLCLLCSLLPGADKMAYTIFWEISPENAEILSTRFTRSIVNSCAQLSYKHAQDIIENPKKDWIKPENIVSFPKIYNGYTVADLADIILKLQKLALILRENRKLNGALKIDQPKISFELNKENGIPISFHQYVIKDSNRLIEEFMLLANISVAKFIYEKYPDISILRAHESPSDSNLTKLRLLLAKNGLELDSSSSSRISECIFKIVEGSKDRDAMNAVINLLVSKSMTRAKYFCSHNVVQDSDFWHFALSIPMYTHFTSPIRRYSDILVHRVLNAALGYEAVPQRPTDELDVLAAICNTQKYNAKVAGEDSSLLYLIHCIQEETKKNNVLKVKAGVVGIFPYNLEVIFIETGHVIKVYYKNLEANNEVCVQINEDDLSSVTFLFLSEKVKLDIIFGSELNVEVKVHKGKLIINKIFSK